jgi:hypothetical protein
MTHRQFVTARTAGRALVGALLVATISSCGQSEAAEEVDIDQSIVNSAYESIGYPLDEYRMTDEQMRTVNHARAVLIRNCLLRFGFDYPLPAEHIGAPHKLIDDRHGLVSEQHAREWGYHQKPPPNSAVYYELALPDEVTPVLHGRGTADRTVPDNGCLGEAGRTLEAGVAGEPQDIVHSLGKEAWVRSGKDPRVTELIQKWRACVRKTGYSYETPHDAVRHWNTNEGAHGKPSQEEISAALADVRCKREVGLPSLWAAVEVAYQRRLIDENSQQLKEQKLWQEAWLRNAARVVTGG